MKRLFVFVLPALLVLAPSTLTKQSGTHQAQSAAPGYVAHVNALGDFIEDPFELPLDQLDEQTLTGLMTNDDGLVEETDAGGGEMVRLNGRFRSVYVGTVGTDGSVEATCLSGTPVDTDSRKGSR